AHHDVALAPPEHVEDAREGHPALDHGRGGGLGVTEGREVLDDLVHAVGEHQLGLEGGLGQARTHGGHGGHGARHDLAVATEGLGDGDDAILDAGDLAHDFTAFWYSASLTSR